MIGRFFQPSFNWSKGKHGNKIFQIANYLKKIEIENYTSVVTNTHAAFAKKWCWYFIAGVTVLLCTI